MVGCLGDPDAGRLGQPVDQAAVGVAADHNHGLALEVVEVGERPRAVQVPGTERHRDGADPALQNIVAQAGNVGEPDPEIDGAVFQVQVDPADRQEQELGLVTGLDRHPAGQVDHLAGGLAQLVTVGDRRKFGVGDPDHPARARRLVPAGRNGPGRDRQKPPDTECQKPAPRNQGKVRQHHTESSLEFAVLVETLSLSLTELPETALTAAAKARPHTWKVTRYNPRPPITRV